MTPGTLGKEFRSFVQDSFHLHRLHRLHKSKISKAHGATQSTQSEDAEAIHGAKEDLEIPWRSLKYVKICWNIWKLHVASCNVAVLLCDGHRKKYWNMLTLRSALEENLSRFFNSPNQPATSLNVSSSVTDAVPCLCGPRAMSMKSEQTEQVTSEPFSEFPFRKSWWNRKQTNIYRWSMVYGCSPPGATLWIRIQHQIWKEPSPP